MYNAENTSDIRLLTDAELEVSPRFPK